MVFVQALRFHMHKNGLSEMDITDVALNGSLLYSTIMEIQNFSSNSILQLSILGDKLCALIIQVLVED